MNNADFEYASFSSRAKGTLSGPLLNPNWYGVLIRCRFCPQKQRKDGDVGGMYAVVVAGMFYCR